MSDVVLPVSTRQMVVSCPEGGNAIFSFPQPLTLESISMLEECCTLMFRGLRRSSIKMDAMRAADAEYLSWLTKKEGP